jgi:hypothetical protein
MGLDSYLVKKTYVKNWKHTPAKERHTVTVLLNGELSPEIKPERMFSIVEEIWSWRKANQIHKWFVDNCQDGEDNCKEYYVSREQLQELVDICEKVRDSLLAEGNSEGEMGKRRFLNTDVAKELLPTSLGFYFGSEAYDENYLIDLKETIAYVKPELSSKTGDFYYQASW